MSWRMRSIASRRSGLGLTLLLFLTAPLLSITGCESLATDTSAWLEPSTQATVAEGAGSAEPFFGSWQGTYTTLEVRDQDGVVANPPVPLNTPLEMHLELHAWSEASGDCGTLTVAGYPNGRVTELSVEGQVALLSIVNEKEGLEDCRSLMTLTLEGDRIGLNVPPELECVSLEWRTEEPGDELHNLGEAFAREGGFVATSVKNYEVINIGHAWIYANCITSDCAMGRWSFDVIVDERPASRLFQWISVAARLRENPASRTGYRHRLSTQRSGQSTRNLPPNSPEGR